jgi:hypothetical protein
VRGEIDNRNKGEQVTEEVDKIRDEIEVIVKNDGIKRGLL